MPDISIPQPTAQGRAEALAWALDAETINVLDAATRVYRALLDVLPDGVPNEHEHIALLEAVQPLLVSAYRVATETGGKASVITHKCSSCGTSMRGCDLRVIRMGRGCCATCHNSDTHGDTDFSASVERMEQLRIEMAGASHG